MVQLVSNYYPMHMPLLWFSKISIHNYLKELTDSIAPPMQGREGWMGGRRGRMSWRSCIEPPLYSAMLCSLERGRERETEREREREREGGRERLLLKLAVFSISILINIMETWQKLAHKYAVFRRPIWAAAYHGCGLVVASFLPIEVRERKREGETW